MNGTKRIRLLAVTLAIAMSAATTAPHAFAGEGGIRRAKHKVEGEYIVVFKDHVRDLPAVAAELAKTHGGKVKRVWQHALKGLHMVIPEGRALALSKDPRVAFVEENAEMFLSSTQDTMVDPSTANTPTSDNRLWHLDRLDGLTPSGDSAYNYCSDGSNVNIYIVDSGVHASHGEFGNRVKTGYNATDDPNPSNQPCGATLEPVVDTSNDAEELNWEFERAQGGHGTSVASIAAGAKVGVAKGANIIPVKVARCDGYNARSWRHDHQYQVGDRIQRSYQYICTTAGKSGATAPASWPPTYNTPLTTDGDDPPNGIYSNLVW
ncbi:MAG TPA: S8 family serine peptidase, partial [Thermoanaerobaculia bacterium]